jgi:hypothetical protein
MWLGIVASIASGLFAGAAIYINLVEHPARLACGPELALKEFGPSYHRATIMQASLAIAGSIAGLITGWQRGDSIAVLAGVLLGSVVPFTLLVIVPTNRRLLDPGLDAHSAEAAALLQRWGRLHAVRSLLAFVAFVMFLLRIRSF